MRIVISPPPAKNFIEDVSLEVFAHTPGASTKNVVHCQPDFFLFVDSLQAQLTWNAARSRLRGQVLFQGLSQDGVVRSCGFASQVFTQSAVTEFLTAIRRWAKLALGVKHASTPAVLFVESEGNRHFMQDPPLATWRYLYVLGKPRDPSILFTHISPRAAHGWKSWFSVGRIQSLHVAANTLVCFPAEHAYSLQTILPDTMTSASGVLLSGYIW